MDNEEKSNQERRHEIQETGRNRTCRRAIKGSIRTCPFHKYVSNLPNVPGTVLDIGNSFVTKHKISALMELQYHGLMVGSRGDSKHNN